MVKSAGGPGKSTLATIIGVVVLMFGATTVFAELQSALDRIWKAPATEKKEGLWNLLRTRILSFGMILGTGFVLLVSLVVSAGISGVGNWWGPLFGGWKFLLEIVNFVFSLMVIAVLFAMIYKWLPRARIGWHDVWIGAGVTALLFTVGKFLIGLYIGKSGVVSGFGAAGSLAIVLVWVYYSAQIFLLGAEFTWVYAYRYGSRRERPRPGQAAAGSPRIPTKRAADERTTFDTRRAPHAPAGPAAIPSQIGAAARETATFPDRHPKLELGLVFAIGAIAAIAALWRGRLR